EAGGSDADQMAAKIMPRPTSWNGLIDSQRRVTASISAKPEMRLVKTPAVPAPTCAPAPFQTMAATTEGKITADSMADNVLAEHAMCSPCKSSQAQNGMQNASPISDSTASRANAPSGMAKRRNRIE